MCLEILAWITDDEPRHQRAATLLSAADTLWADVGASITSFGHFIGQRMRCERHARDTLGGAAFADAYHHGRILEYEAVLAYALDEPRQPAPVPHKDRRPR